MTKWTIIVMVIPIRPNFTYRPIALAVEVVSQRDPFVLVAQVALSACEAH